MRLRGVTLLEMLVVVAIIGILAAIATPAVEPAVKRARLRGAAEEVASFLDDARHRAVTQGRCFRVRVVGGDTLILERRSSVDCVDLSADGWEPAERTRTLRGFTLVGEAVPAVPADERFVFRPSSRLRSDGTLTTTASGSRLEIALPGSPERSTVTATRVGRICSALLTSAPPSLSAPVDCP